MAEHFLNLPGARTLATGAYKLTHEVVSKAAEHQAIVAVLGDPGLGKTFAVEDAARRTGLEHRRLVFSRRTTERALLMTLIAAVTGVVPKGTQAELECTATELLRDRPWLFWIDEAQDLSLRCVEYLRFFYDVTQVALVLVGGHGCRQNLERFPMLRRRIAWEVEFRPLSLVQVLGEIPRYHAIYSEAEADLLRLINEEMAHGNLGNWALFTVTALDLMRDGGRDRLDLTVVKPALRLCGRDG